MKKFAILTLAALTALPASAASVTISGYIDVGYIAAEGGRGVAGAAGGQGAASGSTSGTINPSDGFALNEVNVDIAAQLTNDISSFVSLDWTPLGSNNNAGTIAAGTGNGTDVTVDFAYLDIANPGPFDLNIRAGRIPSVIGIAQRNSESPQTKFINMPQSSPYTVGSLDGVAVYGSFNPINYAVSVTNDDLRGTNELDVINSANVGVAGVGPSNSNGTAGATGLDNNNNFAVSGRIGVVPIEGLEVGVSGGVSKYAPGTTAGHKDLERSTYGFDASYAFGAWSFKGEYVKVQEDDIDAAIRGDHDLSSWYLEAVYDLSSKYSVGVRYNETDMNSNFAGQAATAKAYEISAIQVAGVYRVSDNVHAKAEYTINDEDVRNYSTVINPEIGNDVLAFSLVGAF